mgnify:CR=1 FL=1
MLSYLNDVLGLAAKESPWPDAQRLPLYLRGDRNYTTLTVDDTELLVLYVEQSGFSLPAFQKQLKNLRKYWAGGIVLCFERLTAYQRKALIEQRLSFIVPGSQVYLPCLGVVLQERMASGQKKVTHLSAGAQSLLLHLLYQKSAEPKSKVELSRQIGTSGMNVTRGVQELSNVGLVKTERAGRCDYVSLMYSGRQAYEKAIPYLISPVLKRIFVKGPDNSLELPLSGETALAEMTTLNPPAVNCKAIGRHQYRDIQNSLEPVDPAWSIRQDYTELEIWKYDPQPLARCGMVDVISLAVSLSAQTDERVQLAVDEMLEGYKW